MKKEKFGTAFGRDIYRYTISSGDLQVSVLDFGAVVQSVIYQGVDVVLGFPNEKGYLTGSAYVGANVGRVANRIAGAKFSLNGKEYKLTKNEGKNHLHGGFSAFHLKFYEAEVSENAVKLTYVSPDGEEGYPGTLKEMVVYSVQGNAFRVDYFATSDKDTIWAPTCHNYFNMNGEVGNATSNRLAIYADGYTPVDGELIPTGEVLPVEGTPFDFCQGKKVEDGVKILGGYDHNFVLNGEHAVTMTGDKSGLKMEVYTDMPCLQIYSGIADMGGVQGKNKPYFAKEGIAIEPQFAPNAVNMDGFAKPVLLRGETKSHFVKYEFYK